MDRFNSVLVTASQKRNAKHFVTHFCPYRKYDLYWLLITFPIENVTINMVLITRYCLQTIKKLDNSGENDFPLTELLDSRFAITKAKSFNMYCLKKVPKKR
jgi:hypothetical protein